MGRNLFQKHMEALATTPPISVSHVRTSDEGTAAFTFHYNKAGRAHSCQLKLLASDLEEYPDGNTYLLFTDDDDADELITGSFDIITPLLFGRPLGDALAEITQVLAAAASRGMRENPIIIDNSDEGEEEECSDEVFGGFEIDDDDNFGLSEVQPTSAVDTRSANRSRPGFPHLPNADAQKLRADLLAVKKAGFRVGVMGNLVVGGMICISIRVTKLGISEEAMQAWGLKRNHYFLLLIRYVHGYRDATQVTKDATLSNLTELRVGLCEHYKPSRDSALAAFGQTSSSVTGSSATKGAPIEPLFIGTSLNELLRDRFSKILTFRESCGFNWPSAEAFVHDIQGKHVSALAHISTDSYHLPDDIESKILPNVVKADEMYGYLLKDVSFPLVAMQFALRHFVRCAEFCLVCHCKVEDTFEALKPYVCSRPLCLYQYMALGFGPSIEWEVLSQPYVVDLLISFCYAAAKLGRLKDFPVGIDLKIPRLPEYTTVLNCIHGHDNSACTPTSRTSNSEDHQTAFAARLDATTQHLFLHPTPNATFKTLRAGDWIVVRTKDQSGDFHYRIEEAMFPSYTLGRPIIPSPAEPDLISTCATNAAPLTPTNTRPSTSPTTLPPGVSVVDCYCYNSNFDDLERDKKQCAIVTLLQILPTVIEMQQYLRSQENVHEATLKTWRSRIPNSALNLLRWIIASNRSCIMQVDHLPEDSKSASNRHTKSDDRVAGMNQWMQFKFAQGAPDKEQRFIDSVASETASQRHPTFFAWHGSPIGNWHSIIRQGLRFDEALHGRVYGNGVYMSSNLSTSLGYCGSVTGWTWPNSVLKISSAISLQEVVNAPGKFVSQTPHYVVAKIDWVQTRYLFVRSVLTHTTSNAPIIEYAQDPDRVAKNESFQTIKVPITAVSKSRRPAIGQASTKKGGKKYKTSTDIDQATAEQQEDDANSILSDDEDREWFPSSSDNGDMSLSKDFNEASADSVSHNISKTSGRTGSREIDFKPGTLDVSTIQFLEAPKDATSSATKALMGWYKDAINAQKSTPLHILGWYINPDHLDNMYQWIVELHSFQPDLPLAQDMRSAGVTSVVLEMRFTNQFPFSPPFIRVIQPRFLPFNRGGGGHVTEGGALCMELLTNTGWSAVTSVEGVLLQVQLAMSEEERPARLLYTKDKRIYKAAIGCGHRGDSYGAGEAVAAYERACRAHGWQIPAGFSQFAGVA